MPEAVMSQPDSYQLINKTKQPAFTRIISGRTQEAYAASSDRSLNISHKDVQEVIPGIISTLREMYPGIPRHQIEQFQNLYFGPYMLKADALRDTDSMEQKVLSASIQHAQAHAIFYASSGEADLEYVRKMFDTAVTHDNLAHARDAEGISAGEIGMESELGVIRALHNLGLQVYLPNYSGNGNSLDDEVRTWDVESGVDICAINSTQDGNFVFLIDAKGQFKYPTNDHLKRTGIRMQADFLPQYISDKVFRKLPMSLREHVKKFNPEAIYKARIIIPTSSNSLTTLQDAYLEYDGDKIETLRHFAEVSEGVEDRIGKSIATYSKPYALVA